MAAAQNAFTARPDLSAWIKRVNKDARSVVGGTSSAALANGQVVAHSLPAKQMRRKGANG